MAGWRHLARELDEALHASHRHLQETHGALERATAATRLAVTATATTCCICYTPLHGTTLPCALVPCGHAAFCSACVATLASPQRCPLCREDVHCTVTVRLG